MLSNLLSRLRPQKALDPSAHLQPLHLPPNQLLAQVLADDNLDAALDWLCDNSREQEHSDTGEVSRDWAQRKADLQTRVRSGEFQFQTVREVEINTDGQTEIREVRCAEDRLLIRAIAQVLQPVFDELIAPECVHFAGRGGTQQAVEAVHAQLKANPNAFVMKSDVKGYYAHIDHFILQQQFCTLLPQETVLQRLLWQFMQRTVERGGNYRDIERGIPLGASLSPLLGALYLSPLDALFSNDDKYFYRRYMDDWVIFCHNRWDLRKVVKQVYTVLHALRVTVAEDKTYIGKASKGFAFLGKRILPIGVLPSQAALSRMQAKTVRLYEQGASKKRIWTYWMRWLGWAGGVCICIPAYAYAVEHLNSGRYANPDGGDSDWISFKHNDDGNASNYPYGAFQGGVADTCVVDTNWACDTGSGGTCPAPGGGDSAATTAVEITTSTTISGITFASTGTDLVSSGDWCLIKDGNWNYWAINRDPAGGNYTTTNAATYIKPCLETYTFDSSTGCAAPPAPPPVGASIDIDSGGKPVRYSQEVILDH